MVKASDGPDFGASDAFFISNGKRVYRIWAFIGVLR